MNASHRWHLDQLYTSPDDPALTHDLERAQAFADSMGELRGTFAEMPADALADAVGTLEAIRTILGKANQYATLLFASDVRSPDARALQARVQAAGAGVEQAITFVDLELKALPADHHAHSAPGLAPVRHWLSRLSALRPYTLSEEAEQTTTRKDLTGRDAWVQLYMQLTGGLLFDVEVEGEVHSLPLGAIAPLLQQPDRALRDRAAQAIADGYAPHTDVIAHVHNTLMADHRHEYLARGYDDVLHSTALGDDLSPKIIRTLMETVNNAAGLSHRYEALRARLLGLDDYGMSDRMAPLFGEEPTIEWADARAMVEAAFDAFHPEAGRVVRELLDQGRADVFPREGKQPGAFCMPASPPQPPFVMLNHSGTLRDVFTLAHELGHALHFTLALKQSPLAYWTGVPLAETASVFAELWLHRHLMREWTDDARRTLLLERQVSGAMSTAWRQVSLVNWELAAHAARAEGVVSADQLAALYRTELARHGGDALTIRDRDQWAWARVPHYIFSRFYCYSYAFGKLLTLALFDVWEERGEAFAPAYLDLLAAGGSRSPADLMADLGLDIEDPAFWQRAVDVVGRDLDALEAATA